MASKLSQAARQLLEQAGCSEVADDCVIIGSIDLRILLSKRAVEVLAVASQRTNLAARARSDGKDG